MNTTEIAQEALDTWLKPEELQVMDAVVLHQIYDTALKLIIASSENGDHELEARATHNFNSVAQENLRRYFLNK